MSKLPCTVQAIIYLILLAKNIEVESIESLNKEQDRRTELNSNNFLGYLKVALKNLPDNWQSPIIFSSSSFGIDLHTNKKSAIV